jgi:hypothetical protein
VLRGLSAHPLNSSPKSAIPSDAIVVEFEKAGPSPHVAMIAATRRWFRRNRTTIFISAGVIGAGYIAGQYVLGKIQEARQRMSEEKIAKEKYVHEHKRH